MALLGMGANVQCNGYFPGYCSTKGLIFDSEGSTWTSSNVNSELKNDCHHIGSLPVSSPCNLLGYNKELLKQTMLKHESMFREQIQELHRLYHKQRELMAEIKRNELYNHNLRLEALRSNPSLSSKNGQKICFSPNLPWSNGQSSVLIAETIQLPRASAPQKSCQTCLAPAPAPIVMEESLKDPNPSESKYRKVGKKVLDLQLPADEYIDSEEGECLENERVTEVLQVSGYSSNRVSQVVHDSFEKPHETKSHGFADLHARCNLKEAAAAKSYDFGVAAYHRNNPFYDLSRRTDFGSQNFPNDVIQKLNKRQDLEGCSSNLQPNLEKKHEWWSSSNSGEQTARVLDSFAKGIYTEKQPVSVESLSKNLQELNGLQSFSSLHQIDQGPFCTERKFSSADSSVRTQDSAINGFLGSSSASRTCSPFHIVSGADMVTSGISPAGLWRPPVSNFGQRSMAVQELPCFSSSASLDQSSNSLSRISGFTQKELYQCMSAESGPNLENQNFVLGSCSKSNLLGLPFIGTNDPNKIHNSGSSNNDELRKYVKDSEDMGTPKNLNLNITPADYSDTTASQGIRITGEENKLHDSSIRGLPQLKENPVCKGKPHMSSDLQSFDVLPSESKNKSIEEIERGCTLDVNSPHIHVPHLGHQTPSDEQTKNESLVGIIDLNSCMIEDENMPTDVNFKAPVSPENKECSPPRGESDENQLEVPVQLSEQEDPEVQAELVKIAAETLVSISGFVAHNNLQLTTACSSSESFISSPLRWFAGIVSATANHPENEINEDFSKENDLEDFLLSDMDYFEFMTLNLTETKVKDCCCQSIGQTKQVSVSTSPTRQRKGRTNRVRWRKDFQSEILPSLASLSRYEVTEDLQTIGGLVASGTHPETGSQRSAGRNVLTRGKKRSRASTSNSTDMKKLTYSATTQLGDEKRVLISWGKTCKKRRGKRIPITNPKFILRSI